MDAAGKVVIDTLAAIAAGVEAIPTDVTITITTVERRISSAVEPDGIKGAPNPQGFRLTEAKRHCSSDCLIVRIGGNRKDPQRESGLSADAN